MHYYADWHEIFPMTPKARFERNGREIVVLHDALSDRARVLVDGSAVETVVHRRPFSALWRHAFQMDGEPLEIRIRYGFVEPIVELASAGDPIAPSRLGTTTYASILVVGPMLSLAVRAALMKDAPTPFALGLGVFAGLVTCGLVWLVYGRRSSA